MLFSVVKSPGVVGVAAGADAGAADVNDGAGGTLLACKLPIVAVAVAVAAARVSARSASKSMLPVEPRGAGAAVGGAAGDVEVVGTSTKESFERLRAAKVASSGKG